MLYDGRMDVETRRVIANILLDEKPFGTGAALAREFGITQQSVSTWRVQGIPRSWLYALQQKAPETMRDIELRATQQRQPHRTAHQGSAPPPPSITGSTPNAAPRTP